jgi:hypothetical protein
VLVDEFDLSLGDIAERVGASKPAVSNRLRCSSSPTTSSAWSSAES